MTSVIDGTPRARRGAAISAPAVGRDGDLDHSAVLTPLDDAAGQRLHADQLGGAA